MSRAQGGAKGKPITVTVQDVVTAAEKEIVIPVNVQGVVGKEIISYEFDLRYDPAVLQPLVATVDLVGTVSRGLSVVVNPYEPGLMRVVVYGALPIDEDGVLLYLRFGAVGAAGSVSPILFERIMFNEGDPRAVTVDGQVELSLTAPDPDEISGRLLTKFGAGVPNTRVSLTDTMGLSRRAVSNGLGAYRFRGLQAGQTYRLTVDSKTLAFAPLPVSFTGSQVNVDLIAVQ